jgi:hypothetical protein
VNGQVPVTSPSEVPTWLTDLVREFDKRWSNLDFVGLSDLWEHDTPEPIYVGDEYPAPIRGADALDRHWARVGSRVKAASVSSSVHACDVLSDEIVRAVLLSRWRLTGREGVERSGSSWITWFLVRRPWQYRIFHQMEAQVHLPDE